MKLYNFSLATCWASSLDRQGQPWKMCTYQITDRVNVQRFDLFAWNIVLGCYLNILDFSSSLCTTKKSLIPAWHVQQLLQYTSTSMKVSPCLSGWADSLMAPLFALVRWVRLTTPTPTHSTVLPLQPSIQSQETASEVLREEKVLYLIISSSHNEKRRAQVFYEAANCSVEFPSAKVWQVRAPE